MKRIYIAVVFTLLSFLIRHKADAQEHKKDSLTLLAVSGAGYGFTPSKINEVLKPRFSTTIGFDLSSTKTNFFLLAALDVLSYGYYQQYTEKAQAPYRIKNGNSTFYLLEVTPGYRKTFNHLSLYGYLGPGFGIINLPNAEVNTALQTSTMVNNYSYTASAKAGLGMDFTIGGFILFAQGGFTHNFKKVQGYAVNTFPVYIGVKTDVSGLLKLF